jgi:ribokinase
MKSITVHGSINLDCVAWGDRLPAKGQSIFGYAFSMHAGGKGANQAVQAARMGAEVYLIGSVGADTGGRVLMDSLKCCGVKLDYVSINHEMASGACVIHVDSSGNNALISAPLCNAAITANQIDEAMETIKNSGVFITQLETNFEVVEYGLKTAKRHGVITVLNPAPAHELDPGLYQYIDYFTPNETEAEFYTGILRSQYDMDEWKKRTAGCLLQKGIRNVVITMGDKGAYYACGNREIWVDAYRVDAVDSTAAGDAFNAAFSYGLNGGLPVEECLRLGCRAGAYAAAHKGAIDSLGTKDEIMKIGG